jgi:hypothetical protein
VIIKEGIQGVFRELLKNLLERNLVSDQMFTLDELEFGQMKSF